MAENDLDNNKEPGALKLVIQEKETDKNKKATSYLIAKYLAIIILSGATLFVILRLFFSDYQNLTYYTKLNDTTNQLSTLIDNIRTHYMIHTDEGNVSVERLIEVGAIPQELIAKDNHTLINPYGGKILISKSDKLRNFKDNLESPTFKISYQGLPKDVCIEFAILDWGDKNEGLLAAAVGRVDSVTGADSAFIDIDSKADGAKFNTKTDARGRRRSVRQRQHYKLNVARPGDPFSPTPFSKGNAKTGCSCTKDDCSFALLYTVFGVDNQSAGEGSDKKKDSAFERFKRRLGGR